MTGSFAGSNLHNRVAPVSVFAFLFCCISAFLLPCVLLPAKWTTVTFLGFFLHADVIDGFAFDEESGSLNLAKSSEGEVSFVPKPELEVS